MNKLVSVLTVAFGIVFTSSAFAVTNSSESVLAALEMHVNQVCQCAGDSKETCCATCPETCSNLNAVGLTLDTNAETGELTVVPSAQN